MTLLVPHHTRCNPPLNSSLTFHLADDSSLPYPVGLWPLNGRYGFSEITGRSPDLQSLSGSESGVHFNAEGPFGDANGERIFSFVKYINFIRGRKVETFFYVFFVKIVKFEPNQFSDICVSCYISECLSFSQCQLYKIIYCDYLNLHRLQET